MMAVDTNVYYGKWPFRKAGSEDIQFLKKKCRQKQIDKMLIASVQSIFYEDPFEAEEELHEAIKDDDSFAHIFTVNPKVTGWERDLRQAAEEFDIRGIKIYPGYHEYTLQDPDVDRLCEAAIRYDLPIIVAGRVEDLRVCHMLHPAPVPVDQVSVFLGSHRENVIVLSNFSVGDTMSLKSSLMARDQVYVDMSGYIFTSYPLEKLLGVLKKNIFMVGTEYPLYNQSGILNEVLKARISDEDKEQVLSGNAEKVFYHKAKGE